GYSSCSKTLRAPLCPTMPIGERHASQALLFDALKRYRVPETVGHLSQQVRQRIVAMQWFEGLTQFRLQLRKHVALEPRNMGIQEPVAPVELLGIPIQQRTFFGNDSSIGGSGIVAAKLVVELGGERTELPHHGRDAFLHPSEAA